MIFLSFAARRILSVAILVGLAALAVVVGPRPAMAQLQDVDVVLVLEVADAAGWVVLQDEVLVTPQPGPKPLSISVEAATGGRRSIALAQPRFEVALIKGTPAFKVTVYGKLGGTEARSTLGAFEYALIEKQSSAGDTDVGLLYGLSTVSARILEMYIKRP